MPTFRNLVFIGGLSLYVAVCFLFVGISPVRAAPAEGVQVKPLRTYPVLDRGTTGTGSLTLTNTSTAVQSVSMSTEIFKVNGQDYDYNFTDGSEADWVIFAETTATLEPGQSKVMKYSLAIPADAVPGGHYFALLTAIKPPSEQTGVTEIKRVASLVYLEVSGPITKGGDVTGFSVPWLVLKPETSTELYLSNSGTSHSRAKVLIEGRSWLSQILRQPVKQYGVVEGTIMPSTVRRLTHSLQLPTTPGIYSVSATYSRPQGGQTTLKRTIIYAPIWFLALIGIALILLIMLGIRYVRSGKKYKARN